MYSEQQIDLIRLEDCYSLETYVEARRGTCHTTTDFGKKHGPVLGCHIFSLGPHRQALKRSGGTRKKPRPE